MAKKPGKRGRPSNEERARKFIEAEVSERSDVRLDDDLFGDNDDTEDEPRPPGPIAVADLRDVVGGVSINWLSNVFRMDKNTIKKRLAACPVHRHERAGVPLFDLPTAAGYLVAPKVNVEEFIMKMDHRKWPVHLQKEYWQGREAKQKFMLRAGELWHTSDVFAVFTETFQLIKGQMRLWPASIRETNGLTGAQQDTVLRLVDGMQEEIRNTLTLAPKDKQTPSSAIERENGEIEPDEL